MANKINIIDLDVNVSALISKMSDTRSEIEKLKNAQKELTKDNQTASDSFTKNAVELGRLQSSYTSQKNVVTQLTTENNKFATATNSITSAIEKETTSIASARENNKQLLEIRNQVNTKTVEGQTAITNINAKLDQNNAFIKKNVSAFEEQKMSIGGYSSGIKDAFSAINPLNGGLQGLAQRSADAGGAGNLLTKSLGGVTTGVWGMIKASLAFIATPIGLIVTAIAGVFLILYNIFKNFAPVLNPIKDAFAALGAIFEVLKSGIFALVTGTKSLSETFGGMGGAMKDAAKEAYTLAAAQRAVTKEQRLLDVASAKATTQIQEYILKSKDRTATEQERIDYINKAQKIEEDINNRKLTQQNRIIANARLSLAEGKQISEADMIEMAKNNSAYAQTIKSKYNLDQELIDKLREGEIEKQTILQGHNSIIEKNQNRENKLAEDQQSKKEKAIQASKDAENKRVEAQATAIDKAIQKNKEEIDFYVLNQGIKKKTIEEELAFEEELLNKKLALLKREFDSKKISETAFQNESLKLKNDFAKKQIDVTIANASKELEDYKNAHQQKQNEDTFFSQEKLIKKQNENQLLADEEIKFQNVKLTNGVINQEEYNDAIDLINQDNLIQNEEAQKLRDQAEKERKVVDLENQRLLDQENFTNKFDADTANELLKYQAEIANADKTGADINLINQKHAIAQAKINDAKEQAKRDSAAQTLGDIAKLLGAETDAGKAAAIAQATINTYSGVAQVWSSPSIFPEPFATGQKIISTGVVLASGLQAVKQITSTKTPKLADGGEIPTLSNGVINNGANVVPLSNGDNTLAYVKQGEVILNQQQQALAGGSMFFKSLGVPGFTGGGVVGNTNLGSQGGVKIDIELMAQMIAQANRSLPAPVVSVHEINYSQNSVRVIENGANF